MDFEKAYKDLMRDIDIAIKGQKEGETKIVLQNLKERNTESEDERIRKGLLKMISNIDGGHPFEKYGIIKKEALTYLEKQKEPHFTKRNALFDKCVAKCDPAIMKKVSDKVDEMLVKEQKPADKLTLENPLTGEKVYEREIPEFMKGADPKDVEAIIH